MKITRKSYINQLPKQIRKEVIEKLESVLSFDDFRLAMYGTLEQVKNIIDIEIYLWSLFTSFNIYAYLLLASSKLVVGSNKY